MGIDFDRKKRRVPSPACRDNQRSPNRQHGKGRLELPHADKPSELPSPAHRQEQAQRQEIRSRFARAMIQHEQPDESRNQHSGDAHAPAEHVELFLEAAEAAVAGGEVLEGQNQILLAEIRPAFLCDPQLRIADLPQQKIAKPHLARRADY